MIAIFTHTDLDGIASASLILKALGRVDKIEFIQPYQLHQYLKKVPPDSQIYISDLGINGSTFPYVLRELRRILNNGGRVKWFDHHVWEKVWIEKVKKLGVELFVDTSTCAAGVVSKYLPVEGKHIKDLVSATCSIDLWVFDDWKGNFLTRYASFKDSVKWKIKVVNELAQFKGNLNGEMLRIVEEFVDKELRVYSKVIKNAYVKSINNIRTVYYFKKGSDEHLTSYIGNLLLSRFNGDIAVICKEDSISLRSRCFDVRNLAVKLGGGGHPRAAGAKMKIPLIYKIMLLIGFRKYAISWCVKKVSEAVKLLQKQNQPS